MFSLIKYYFVYELDNKTKIIKNKMSIKVAVRLRPFNTREIDRGEKEPIINMVVKLNISYTISFFLIKLQIIFLIYALHSKLLFVP